MPTKTPAHCHLIAGAANEHSYPRQNGSELKKKKASHDQTEGQAILYRTQEASKKCCPPNTLSRCKSRTPYPSISVPLSRSLSSLYHSPRRSLSHLLEHLNRVAYTASNRTAVGMSRRSASVNLSPSRNLFLDRTSSHSVRPSNTSLQACIVRAARVKGCVGVPLVLASTALAG